MIPNAFECMILGICFILIASLMNMFPVCRWLAEKKIKAPQDAKPND